MAELYKNTNKDQINYKNAIPFWEKKRLEKTI